MRDVELYRALLGLTAPWTVAGVDVDMKGQRVVVRVEAGPGRTRVRSAGHRRGGMTASPAAGATWTRCSSRPGSRPTCRG